MGMVVLCGCQTGDLQQATAAQLESALLSLINQAVSQVVYNLFDLPTAAF